MKTLFKIPAANLSRLQAKIADIAKRAAKIAKKFPLADATPITLTVGEKVVVPRKDDITGLDLPPKVYFMVEVTGAAPKIAGWTFVATLQHEEGGTILRPVPTVELPEGTLKPYRSALPACDHCKAKRRRNDTFVVRSDAGELKQVGRNCLVDFLGVMGPEAVASMAEYLAVAGAVAEEFEGEGGGGNGEDVEDLTAYLAYVSYAMREFGWLSKTKARELEDQGEMVTPTAVRAWMGMHPPKGTPVKDRMVPEPRDREAAETAVVWAEEHFLTVDADTLNDYQHNLRVAFAGGVVTARLSGILASLLPYYERAMGKEKAKKMQADAPPYFGTVSKRSTFTLVLVAVYDFETQYGVQHVHRFLTPEGSVAVWKTGSEKLEPGTYNVKATVKAHNTYKDSPQTVLSRCVCEKVEDLPEIS